MFCAFEGPPKIVRLHGRAEVVTPDDDRFEATIAEAGFEQPTVPESRRAVIEVSVQRISDSCGFGVPLMAYEGERVHQDRSSEKRIRSFGRDAYVDYQRKHNAQSIDGLPAVEV